MRFGELDCGESTPLTAWTHALNARAQGKRYLLEIGGEPSNNSTEDACVNYSVESKNGLMPRNGVDEENGLADDQTSLASDALTALTSPIAFTTPPPTIERPKISTWASLFKNSTDSMSYSLRAAPSTGRNTPVESNGHKNPVQYKSLKDIILRYRSSFRSRSIVPRGFINRGNMCFMNAILQPLIFCAPFYNLLHTIATVVPHNFTSQTKTPLLDALIRFMQEFSMAAEEETEISFASPILPEYILDAMRANEKFRVLFKGRQEDAEEYLGFLLDDLHEEFVNLIKDEMNEKPRTTEENQWIEVGSSKNKTAIVDLSNISTPITRIFGGRLRSTIKAPGAKESHVIEPFHSLHLDITPDEVLDISDAIWKAVEPEVLDGYISPTASTEQEEKGETIKQALFEQLPNVLILHLKRFTYVDGQIEKVTKHVTYGLDLTIPAEMLASPLRRNGPVRYHLIAVVYHHGKRAVNGHYTCELRRGDGRWLHFDDSIVSPIAESSVTLPHTGADRSEYLLFYQQTPI